MWTIDDGPQTMARLLWSIVGGPWSAEWLTRPGSQQLGAKWVEVNGGVRGSQSQRKSEFETWPATPVERVAPRVVRSAPNSIRLAS